MQIKINKWKDSVTAFLTIGAGLVGDVAILPNFVNWEINTFAGGWKTVGQEMKNIGNDGYTPALFPGQKWDYHH